MALEHSIVQRLRRKRTLSTSEREVNSGAKSTAQAEIKERKHMGRSGRLPKGDRLGHNSFRCLDLGKNHLYAAEKHGRPGL